MIGGEKDMTNVEDCDHLHNIHGDYNSAFGLCTTSRSDRFVYDKSTKALNELGEEETVSRNISRFLMSP